MAVLVTVGAVGGVAADWGDCDSEVENESESAIADYRQAVEDCMANAADLDAARKCLESEDPYAPKPPGAPKTPVTP